jgi:Family of unknown function (DUF6335)
MARRKAARRSKASTSGRKRKSGRPPAKKASPKKAARRVRSKKASAQAAGRRARKARDTARPRSARLDRKRRTLEETVPTPPSSLDMDRHGSAARTGRDELDERRREHRGMSPEIAGGDIDVDLEDAYFTGESSPGGDNPTPDQDVVDDIGRALGVEYEDNEELKGSDKVTKRDKHRWELDPASSEDYKERK